ncbi:MAG: nicotinate (nicotinamide) nucleotide adenylyltransferase [Treponema sp.]|nr:nicotinate (nicotinamide) nucleotide adenylyltransferase [Treponema sp.]
MKLAILGGSFNPVHLGHLHVAEAVLSVLGYDRIVMVPAFTSPFKPGAHEVSPADRLDMLAASIPGDPRIAVDGCEILRGGVSYTIDTIADIRGRYNPAGKPGLIIGDDLARTFSQWRQAADIAAETDIIIAHRESSGPVGFPYPYTALDNAVMEISSASIRDRVQNGEPWRSLVPPGARFIIEDRRLYGYAPEDAGNGASGQAPVSGTGVSHELIARVEAEVRSLVSPSRFLHCRGAALTAYDLCARFGLDPDRGYLAGMAHDMAKSLPEGDMKRLARRDGGNFSKLERKKPSLLHGRAGAVLLRQKFGIEDEDILEAVRHHTAGTPEMGPLARAVYIADKIEPSRRNAGENFRDISRFAELDGLFSAVLEETVAFLRLKQTDLSAGTLALLDAVHTRRDL